MRKRTLKLVIICFSFVLILFLIVIFIVTLFLKTNIAIRNEQLKIMELKEELRTIQIINEQIQEDIDSKFDLSYIEQYAKYKLGMQKSSDSQITPPDKEGITTVTEHVSKEQTTLEKCKAEIEKYERLIEEELLRKEELLELKKKIESEEYKDYIEQVAREKLGLVMPDEIIFNDCDI